MRHLICLLLIAGAMAAACKNNEGEKDSVRMAKEVNRDKSRLWHRYANKMKIRMMIWPEAH